jgi:hypothetical protein
VVRISCAKVLITDLTVLEFYCFRETDLASYVNMLYIVPLAGCDVGFLQMLIECVNIL